MILTGIRFANDCTLHATDVKPCVDGILQTVSNTSLRALSTGASDWTADDDNDGFPRLLEYALGGQPRIREPSLHAPVCILLPASGELSLSTEK